MGSSDINHLTHKKSYGILFLVWIYKTKLYEYSMVHSYYVNGDYVSKI